MIICLFFWQFFDHPVIIDFLTERWYGGYENRKLSRLWWVLLTVWCLFDIVLFPLIFLLTRVIGKVLYLHEFDDISLNVDSQIFDINDCGPWIYKQMYLSLWIVVLFCFHFILVWFLSLFSVSVTSRGNWTCNIWLSCFELQFSLIPLVFVWIPRSSLFFIRWFWLVLLMTKTSERLSCFNSSTNSNFISFTSKFFLFKDFKQLHLYCDVTNSTPKRGLVCSN